MAEKSFSMSPKAFAHIQNNAVSRFHLLSITTFILYLLLRIILIFYPQPNIGGVEINVIYFIQRLLDGQTFYTDPELSPYAIAQYSPLYYYITAGAGKLFGVGADDLYEVFVINRSVSLILNLIYIFIVFKIASTIFLASRRNSFYAAIMAFIFLEITSFGRPDSLNHVFFMFSLYAFMRAIVSRCKTEETKWIILSGLIAGVALFCKQTSVILPGLFGLWLLMQNKIRQIFIFVSTYLVVLAVMLLLIDLLTGGLFLFYKNGIMGINNGIGLHWYRTVIVNDYYYSFGLVFVLVAIGIFFILIRDQTKLARFAILALLFLFVSLNLVALKFGSNPGYFTEWWTLLFIILAACWPGIIENTTVSERRLPNVALSAILILKLVLLIKPANAIFIDTPFSKAFAQYNDQKNLATKVLHQIQRGEGDAVFCNYYTTDYFLSSFLFRHAVMPQMDIVMLASYPQRDYNYEDFVNKIKNGKFKWMLTMNHGIQKQFFEIHLDQYRLVDSSNTFHLYQYKP